MASKTRIINLTRMSRVFQPMATSGSLENGEKAEEIISKSHRLMVNYGIIKPVNIGMYALLPLGMRILNKLIELVDKEMANIGAEKILLPALTSAALWKKTKRYDSSNSELFKVTDRHEKEYILGPTYEEAICDLVSSVGHLSTRSLPLKLYQISSKWRDEMKPRLGLLRSREFIMKDLYTFDASLEKARYTYDLVCESYNNIFRQIGIKYTKSIGDVGTIGGLMSHEYHYVSDIGEDMILECPSCHFSINQRVSETTSCPECKSELHQHTAAEVGHTFLLDTKYSKQLKVMYVEQHKSKPLVMGCFGLGLSRIITSAVEILSTNDELRWPLKLAPYTVCIIPPKAGSKEENTSVYVEQLFEVLCKYNIDAILDDRTHYTIGKRLLFTRASGYPYIIVIGKTATQSVPLFELHDVNNATYRELSLDQISDYFQNISFKS
ncbi:PREDICTED: probable proline--tRNA ligase, mitochondrial [Wasmannia auropunctata]|uniref:probable proline--tRNA ligase, mitochondrial n=1 Tax=Wasmannia auropunctata TaxID=64793 RepID=UPI0005F04650|nr:PREDICTED: probable proline--tRNA ligase, mitochondrial [Wasmannia auropunctata]XP_011684945.1 PREDICTED: probable proline--tRNA ligase, mitochondrial [Wasmannia auropunctata]